MAALFPVDPEALADAADGHGLLADAGPFRLGVFVTLLVAFSLWESWKPRRPRTASRPRRWSGNGILMLVGTVLTRLLVPAGAVGTALWAEANGVGLFQLVELPVVFEAAASIVLFDLALFAQHVASHRVDLLWRIHRVHHADLDLDASSGIRFHPLELLLSLGWKAACVTAMGAPPMAVLLSETILSSMSLFTHANLALPLRLDAALRRFVITPDVHRVHHSTDAVESNRNFGFALIAWDRIFRTYRAQPEVPHAAMPLGLSDARDERATTSAASLLVFPFR